MCLPNIGHLLRAVDKVLSINFNSTCDTNSPNPMFDHWLESSLQDDSNKWSNIGLGEEIGLIEMKTSFYL